jgi:hypothetical protein
VLFFRVLQLVKLGQDVSCRSGRSSSEDKMDSSYCVGSFFLALGRRSRQVWLECGGKVWDSSGRLLNSGVWYKCVVVRRWVSGVADG